MFKAGFVFLSVAIASALIALADPRLCTNGRRRTGANPGSALQSLEEAGPGSLKHGKSDDDLIKEAKRKITDADPRVRVDGLEKLRYVGDKPEVTEMLFRGANDSDVRVRIKAIDVLGARGVNDAVPLMSQALFLRETPAVEKLHLVAALGVSAMPAERCRFLSILTRPTIRRVAVRRSLPWARSVIHRPTTSSSRL